MRCHHRIIQSCSFALPLLAGLSIANAADVRRPPRTEGVVERIRIDAHGQASGVILSDHTEIVTPRVHNDALMESVRVGDTVRIQVNNGAPKLVSARTGRMVPIDTAWLARPDTGATATQRPARGGGPIATPTATTVRFDDARPLPDLTVAGRVSFFTYSPSGLATGFVMEDGAQVHVIPRVAGVLATLSPGDEIRVHGRGIHGSYGAGLWAVGITRTNGQSMLDLARGPGAEELAYGR